MSVRDNKYLEGYGVNIFFFFAPEFSFNSNLQVLEKAQIKKHFFSDIKYELAGGKINL